MEAKATEHQDGLSEHISEAIRREECTVYRNVGLAWSSNNSTVTTCPPLEIQSMVNRPEAIHAAMSFVSVTGRSDEQLHHHSSHLLGIVVGGEGHLLTPRNTGEDMARTPLTSGDLFVVPRGSRHVIECDSDKGLKFISLEISDEEIEVGIASIKAG